MDERGRVKGWGGRGVGGSLAFRPLASEDYTGRSLSGRWVADVPAAPGPMAQLQDSQLPLKFASASEYEEMLVGGPAAGWGWGKFGRQSPTF